MKALSTKEFNNKLQNYTNSSFQRELSSFLEEISKYQHFTEIKNQFEQGIDGIYFHKIGDYRIFFSIEEVDNLETLILVDLIIKENPIAIPSFRNPNLNKTINPNLNRTINPILNRTINPILNRTINPILNRTINPNLNRTINPILNRTINPNLNRTINPNLNRSINPKINRTINPKINPSYDGYYLFDLKNQIIGYFIKANEKVNLLFNTSDEVIGFSVQSNDGFNLFRFETLQYISFFCSDGSRGYNQFNLDGKWIGHVK